MYIDKLQITFTFRSGAMNFGRAIIWALDFEILPNI